jgi:chaperonin GroES
LAINGPISEEAMNFRPLHDRVLLRRVEEEERSAGGVIIPDTAKEKPMQGEIMPLDIAVGDRVLIGKWSGTEVKLDGEELLILNESDVLATIETA